MSASNTPRFADKLRNKSVLVIGGTSGIGLGTAIALCESGANVIISSSREAKLSSSIEKIKSTVQSLSPNAITGFTCDLASPDVEANLQSLLKSVTTHLKENLNSDQLDHLVYTAGDSLPLCPLEEVTLAKFQAALQVRGISALLAVKTFLSLIPKSNLSTITLTTGAICEKPFPGGWAMTSFGGAGLNGMTRQLAFDLKPIRVNCVAPGVVDTELWAGMSAEAKKKTFEGYEKALPTGRVPGPEDIAESYIYLMRDRNVTGSVVHTNGGAFL